MEKRMELVVGDLVMWTGEQSTYTLVKRRVIYEVTECIAPVKPDHVKMYRYKPVFDIENPLGTVVDSTALMSSNRMKRIDLVDLGMVRLMFDTFIVKVSMERGWLQKGESGE